MPMPLILNSFTSLIGIVFYLDFPHLLIRFDLATSDQLPLNYLISANLVLNSQLNFNPFLDYNRKKKKQYTKCRVFGGERERESIEFTHLTIVRSNVDRASLWNVIITLVGGRSFR